MGCRPLVYKKQKYLFVARKKQPWNKSFLPHAKNKSLFCRALKNFIFNARFFDRLEKKFYDGDVKKKFYEVNLEKKFYWVQFFLAGAKMSLCTK